MKYNYIPKIVKASGVQKDELVLIHFWGEDEDKEIANQFLVAVSSLGATPVLLQQARLINYSIFCAATETCFNENYFEIFSKFDAVLDVFAYQPIAIGYELPPKQKKLYQNYITQLFSALMKSKRFTQIRIPTQANAEESGLLPEDYISRMEKAYDIDYDMLYLKCEQNIKQFEKYNQFILKTGADCELFFNLTGRKWHIDAGDGDWPCGEIYIAPNESKTHGTVFFDHLFIEDVGEFHEVILFIEEGMIIDSNNDEVKKYICLLPTKDTVVCELGLGMNPNVIDLCGYTVLDEKKANSFHIAIGSNDMFGGQNKASRHVDFVNSGSFNLQPMK